MGERKHFLHRKDWIILAIATVGQLVFLFFSWRVIGEPGYPLDDGWIYQTYARNIAQTGRWAFIPGVPSTGSTSILWTPLLVPGYLIPGMAYIWTQLMGLFSLTAIGIAGARLLSSPAEKAYLPIGGSLAFSWHLIWAAASGMETAFFAALVLTFFAVFRKMSETDDPFMLKRGFFLGLWAGILLLGRPEGVLAVGTAGAYQLFFMKTDLKTKARWALAAGGGFLLLLIPFFGMNTLISGAVFPNTFYAKQTEYAPLWEIPYLRRFFDQAAVSFSGAHILLIPGIILLVTSVMRGEKKPGVVLPLVWVFIHWALYAARLPVTYQHGRYAIPTIPVLIALGVCGMMGWVEFKAEKAARRMFSLGWALTFAVILITSWLLLGAPAYAEDVAYIQNDMVGTARWLDANTDDDVVVAAHDIGALGYFAPRRLLDLAGLVSPEVIPVMDDAEGLREFVLDGGADYLVVFPGWSTVYQRMLDDPRIQPVWDASQQPGYRENDSHLGSMTIYMIESE